MCKLDHVILVLLTGQFLAACSPRVPLPAAEPPASGEEATPAVQPAFTAAGVPKYLGERRDYEAIFSTLAEAGVGAFFPTFQYQEIPMPASLGFEQDFLPPCTPDDPAFMAMRANGIKLIVPGGLLYPPGDMPPLEDDPLAALRECAGSEGITAVLSIDEPFGAVRDPADPYQDVRAIYERVKRIAPGVPVWMVHAPIPAKLPGEDGRARPVTQDEIAGYLVEVRNFSVYADGFGFDVYPVPMEVADITAPSQGGDVGDYATTVENYARWLSENAAGKTTFLVLQGFPYDRLFNDGVDIPAPTEAELREMVCRAQANGVGYFVWWGQSFLLAEDQSLWDAVLAVTEGITADPAAYCADAFATNAAQENEGVVLIGDPEFNAVADIIWIEWIGYRLA